VELSPTTLARPSINGFSSLGQKFKKNLKKGVVSDSSYTAH